MKAETFKGLMHKFTHSETQHRGRSLQNSWAMYEGDLLTSFRECAKGAGSCKNFF